MSPTSTLAAFIDHATDRLLQRADVKVSPSDSHHPHWDSLIFLGNLHDVVPRRLLLDNILNPREKFAWQLIRLHATDNNTGAAFPSYNELQIQLSNYPVKEKASRSTVSLTLLTLRLTRWLSLCHRARDKRNGRILGNIYVLHDEPLTLLDAQTFDPDYLKLLAHCICHANPRLCSVAQELLITIHSDSTLKYLSSRMNLIEERIIWQQEQAMTQSAQKTRYKNPNSVAQSYNKTKPKAPSLNNEPSAKNRNTSLKSNKKQAVSLQDSNTTLQSSKKRKLQVPRARQIAMA
ncbi:STY4528 family pathogenicity island replication protein [Photorhabdus tasmaniensis]